MGGKIPDFGATIVVLVSNEEYEGLGGASWRKKWMWLWCGLIGWPTMMKMAGKCS